MAAFTTAVWMCGVKVCVTESHVSDKFARLDSVPVRVEQVFYFLIIIFKVALSILLVSQNDEIVLSVLLQTAVGLGKVADTTFVVNTSKLFPH